MMSIPTSRSSFCAGPTPHVGRARRKRASYPGLHTLLLGITTIVHHMEVDTRRMTAKAAQKHPAQRPQAPIGTGCSGTQGRTPGEWGHCAGPGTR